MESINWQLEAYLSDERCTTTRRLIRQACQNNDIDMLQSVCAGFGAENIARLIEFDARPGGDTRILCAMLGWAVEKLGTLGRPFSEEVSDGDDIPF